MKLIAVLLLFCCSTIVVTAQEEPCVSSTTNYAPAVKSALELPLSTSVSWIDKRISRLGDGAAVVLIRMGAPESLKKDSQIGAALHILELAYDCPTECIEDEENRSTAVTLLLLDAFSMRTHDSNLQTKIEATRRYVISHFAQGSEHK